MPENLEAGRQGSKHGLVGNVAPIRIYMRRNMFETFAIARHGYRFAVVVGNTAIVSVLDWLSVPCASCRQATARASLNMMPSCYDQQGRIGR